MKTNVLDFLIIGTLVTFIFLISWCVTLFFVPTAKYLFSDHYAIADFLLFILIFGIASGLLLRSLNLIFPIKMGEFSMESREFGYFKVRAVILFLGNWAMRPFSNTLTEPLIIKLFGGKIGANFATGGFIDEPQLVSIGDNVIVGCNSILSTNAATEGKIAFGRVKIGNHVTIGMNSVIMHGCEIGDHVLLMTGSVLMPGTKIPDGEVWKGNPARKWEVYLPDSSKAKNSLKESN